MKDSRSATALWTRGYRNFLNLIYPRCCPLCHEILADQNALVCPKCAGKIRPITGPRCFRCGKPVEETREYCRDCTARRIAFDQGKGIFLYDDRMKRSIVKYKYHGRREYGRFYGKAMYRYSIKELERWKPDLIVPVPMYWKKQRMRGFNQAGYLADRMAEWTGIPVDHHLVTKTVSTRSQKKLSASERRKNLKKAFRVNRRVDGKRILLMDDVYTTGSTMDALAACLKEAGAQKVWFLTLCIGRDRQ